MTQASVTVLLVLRKSFSQCLRDSQQEKPQIPTVATLPFLLCTPDFSPTLLLRDCKPITHTQQSIEDKYLMFIAIIRKDTRQEAQLWLMMEELTVYVYSYAP